jgi:predicted DNA-binding transcriptional regulator AlpA
MPRVVGPDDLLDAAEVAELLGLRHRNSVRTYLHRYPDFPRPVGAREVRSRLWVRGEVLTWPG